jgi:hypothetical protein
MEVEMENYKKKNDIIKLKEKIGSTYYQLKQIITHKRPRLQKVRNIITLKEMIEPANKLMTEMLRDKHLNLTKKNLSI